MSKFITYENTPENAELIGWDSLAEEYKRGDTDAAFVTHNYVEGLFFFHNEEEMS